MEKLWKLWGQKASWRMFPQSRSGDLVRMARSQKEKQILHCELCGKPLHPEEGEPIEHGKMKICKACYIDLNWLKSKCARGRVRNEVVF